MAGKQRLKHLEVSNGDFIHRVPRRAVLSWLTMLDLRIAPPRHKDTDIYGTVSNILMWHMIISSIMCRFEMDAFFLEMARSFLARRRVRCATAKIRKPRATALFVFTRGSEGEV